MREFLQFFTFSLSVTLTGMSIYCVVKHKQKYWYNFIIYGGLGCIFYIFVIFHDPNIHIWSTVFRTIQTAIILGNVAGIVIGRRGR